MPSKGSNVSLEFLRLAEALKWPNKELEVPVVNYYMYDCHINKLGVIFFFIFLVVFLLDFNFNQQSCPVIGTLYWDIACV